MPIKKQYRKKRAAPKRRQAPRRRAPRRSGNVPDLASLSVKRSLGQAGGAQYNANVLYNLMNTQLVDYPRAVQVAGAYQHYRIKKISLTFKPSSDTFTVGGATKPRLYYMIDKSGSIPTTVSLEGLKAMGARPRDLDERSVTISWSPSILESAMYANGVNNATPSKYKISPWLSTSAVPVQPGVFVPSGIDHLGLYWYLDMINTAGYQYAIECEVQFQFKKPLTDLTNGVEAIPATLAQLNNSPDGVVGGGDGL